MNENGDIVEYFLFLLWLIDAEKYELYVRQSKNGYGCNAKSTQICILLTIQDNTKGYTTQYIIQYLIVY